MVTDIRQLDPKKVYTYTDYLTWQLQERVELVKGYITKMAPAPGRRHQEVSGQLFLQIGNQLRHKPCRLYSAPFDVKLPTPEGDTVVQPDLCIICDLDKLTEQGCHGAPDLIIEILSPGNSRRERKEKFELYQESGVQEYWLVEPYEESILVYVLNEEGQYIGSKPFVPGEVIHPITLPGLEVEVSSLFQDF